MRLYELAYSCRLYADFTDYDKSIKEFREATSPGLPLGSGLAIRQNRNFLSPRIGKGVKFTLVR